ncbi:DEKNAAC102568 [Brettanomyces naardenensis]|uniref:Acyl-CoA desaturase n=1 Tax=Brettanomyces naardenensis TaxID=13370 RepID=A0A448YL58_BRENA|nr:DEKNAAC102568 [Brettanomyces naardenensis]
MSSVESVDITMANSVAAGTNKATRRIVASGIGGKLMGTKSMTQVTAEELARDSVAQLLAKDKALQQKYKKEKHISEQPWTSSNWYQHINWLNTALVLAVPLVGCIATKWVKPTWQTLALAFVMYVASGASITAGYHRLWSHRSYRGRLPVRLFYALFGASAIEGSIKWWGHSHRLHHRYTDTDRDPYDARKGFWYSHIGWMLLVPNPRFKARADISDLVDDWVVRVQHRHYLAIMLFMAFIFPALVAKYFFNDFWGGFVYAGIFKSFFIQQATFCVNSLAHWIGVQPYDDTRTPRDHVLTAFVTFGEGYHNFHHEFPSDYRNALKWYQYDPTKVIIWITSKIGLAYNLKRFSQNAIDQCVLQQKQKQLDKQRAKLNWGPQLGDLPVWEKAEFFEHAKNQKGLVIISGIVHDCSEFLTEHPGGQALLKTSFGKDATVAFNGGVYAHSNAAHNLLATMRVAVIKGSGAGNNTYDQQIKALAEKTRKLAEKAE